jgi:hypothetical protein
MTDCVALQRRFDLANENNDRQAPGTRLFDVTLAYMDATDARMRALGCY